MEIIKRGAEAILYIDYFEGMKVLVKERIKKSYRLEVLDKKLRVERTRREANLMREARKVGVNTPQIFHVDEENCRIIMEFIDGKRLKDVLDEWSEENIEKIFIEVGKFVGKMHSADIIHGDLTTSNILVKDDKIYFIDFGLGYFSKRIEDKGTDLNLFKEAIRATHPKLLNLCWQNIVIGYRKTFEEWEKVLKRVDEIEKRARYAERVIKD
ncbi:MAG: KEOPS complex kinase/ATPase Bud32 [Candidatus Aenigmarchaeota archaeon]|jgi:Kae1-associated kinase Bud32|nr:KEOPS complex kinase/ATPase Bud32 [Candidatus Aenigmarchaeota archaeon]